MSEQHLDITDTWPVLPDYRGPRFAAQYNELIAERETAEHESGETAALDQQIADRKFDIFLAQHDNTGAFITERLGQDMAASLRTTRPIKLDAEGALLAREGDKYQHLLFVSLGELDRLNAEGGHAAGDAGLRLTVETIETVVREELERRYQGPINAPAHEQFVNGYDIYRYGGNEFAIRLHGVSLSEDEVRILLAKISGARPEVLPGREPPPLATAAVSLAEARDIANQIYREERRTGAPPRSEDDWITASIAIAKKVGEVHLEAAKFKESAQRLLEKLDRGDTDVQRFFDRYLQKVFVGTRFADLAAFKESMSDRAQFEHLLEETAYGRAFLRMREKSKGSEVEDAVIMAHLAERVQTPIPKAARFSPPTEAAQPRSSFPERSTRGALAIAAARERLIAADADKLTAIKEQQPLAMFEKKQVLARFDLMLEETRRDTLTGLLKRRDHYRTVAERVEHGRPGGTLFIDMGFLKYFDREGGADVGNQALVAAAQILEDALIESGVAGTVTRYGGDEFTIVFDGSEGEAEKIIQAIAIRKEQTSKIPRGARSREAYAPEQLVFNYGVAYGNEAEQVLAEYVARNRAATDMNPAARLKTLAEIETKIADMGVEREKAADRIEFLVGKARAGESIETLLLYSSKAIFGAVGEALIRQLAGARGETGLSLRETIRAFVAEQIREQAHRATDAREVEDLLIESLIREGRLRRRIETLEATLGQRDTRITELRAELNRLARERTDIAAARRRISGNLDDGISNAAE